MSETTTGRLAEVLAEHIAAEHIAAEVVADGLAVVAAPRPEDPSPALIEAAYTAWETGL